MFDFFKYGLPSPIGEAPMEYDFKWTGWQTLPNTTNAIPASNAIPGGYINPTPMPMPGYPGVGIAVQQTPRETVRVSAELLKALDITPFSWWYCDITYSYYEVPIKEWEALVLTRKIMQESIAKTLPQPEQLPEPQKEKPKRAISLKDI